MEMVTRASRYSIAQSNKLVRDVLVIPFRVGIRFDFPCVRFITMRRYICLTEEEYRTEDGHFEQ